MRPASGEDSWLLLARGGFGLVSHEMGGVDKKARIERMCISLPYVETFNSKVIKGFVPELRSRYVLFEFRDSYVLCDICHICNEYPMHISHIHVYGYGTHLLGNALSVTVIFAGNEIGAPSSNQGRFV